MRDEPGSECPLLPVVSSPSQQRRGLFQKEDNSDQSSTD